MIVTAWLSLATTPFAPAQTELAYVLFEYWCQKGSSILTHSFGPDTPVCSMALTSIRGTLCGKRTDNGPDWFHQMILPLVVLDGTRKATLISENNECWTF
jgi:hypothetical protein